MSEGFVSYSFAARAGSWHVYSAERKRKAVKPLPASAIVNGFAPRGLRQAKAGGLRPVAGGSSRGVSVLPGMSEPVAAIHSAQQQGYPYS